MALLESITVYPIKSLDGISVPECSIISRGALAWDRRLAITNQSGELLNGKHDPAIHRLRAKYDLSNETVTLSYEEGSPKTFSLLGDRSDLEKWLGEVLNDQVIIYENPEGGFPDDPESSGPTIVSTGTLEQVAEWFHLSLEEAARRFRANLVVSGVDPFWEDQLYGESGLKAFKIGDVNFIGTNPCQRCVVPTRDSITGAVTPRFAKEFQTKREETFPGWAPRSRFDHFYRLAVNTLPPEESIGKSIRVGDVVTI